MGREFELKYTATPEQQRSIEATWENWSTFSMETSYFDTADKKLAHKNCTLRRRLENGVCVCTLKTPAPGFGRGEWNCTDAWCRATVEKLLEAGSLPAIDFEQLIPICGARFIRRAKIIELENCTVEVALDCGVLQGGNREIPLCEVEIEVKSGTEAIAVTWAKEFARTYHLLPEHRSKFSRAAALAEGI